MSIDPTIRRPPGDPVVGAASHPEGRPKVAAILDTFSEECLRPECHLITFGPDDWRQSVEEHPPDAVFVESAWRGKGDAWMLGRMLAHSDLAQKLRQLVGWARERGIPTLFWNKEDPVHFEKFFDLASTFDHVFTSDAASIPAYRGRLGHDRVHALPFAAQPALHHPVTSGPRSGTVCFAGSYFTRQHERRRQDMEFLLRPAMDFGLDIYDRNQGSDGITPEVRRFPEVYRPCIRGQLAYGAMSDAYRRYRVFLNVNTVTESPTMFARRVFELLACGTPVISNPSRGIVELLGEDIVFLSESANETRNHLGRLLGDPDLWARTSVRGLRRVMEAHTYAHRWQDVSRQAGLPTATLRPPRFDVLARVRSSEDAAAVGTMAARQVHRPARLLLVSDRPLDAGILAAAGDRSDGLPVRQVALSDEASGQRELLGDDAVAGDHVCLFKPVDHYGPNYLKDYALAFTWSGAQVLGKQVHFGTSPRGDVWVRPEARAHFRWVDAVASGSAAWRKGAIPIARVRKSLEEATLRWDTHAMLSIDAYNYVSREPQPGTTSSGPLPPLPDSMLRAVEL